MALGEHPIDRQNSPERVGSDQSQGVQTIISNENVNYGSAESRVSMVALSAFTGTTCCDDSKLSLATFYAYALSDTQTSVSGFNSIVGYVIGVLVVLVISVVVYLQSYSLS